MSDNALPEGVVFLQNVRLSFPHLDAPHSANQDGSNPRFSGDFILQESDPQWATLWSAIEKTAQLKWNEAAPQVIQMIQNDRKLRCYGWGQEKVDKQTFKVYDGYEGNVFITANNMVMPQIIAADGTQIDPMNQMACQMEARRMYGGCRVNVALRPWPQDNQHGRGLRCDLVAIQFAGDDTAFGSGGAPDASAMFGQVQASAAPSPAGAAAPVAPAVPAGAPAGVPGGAPITPPGGAGAAPAPAAAPVAPAAAPPATPAVAPAAVAPAQQPIQGQDGNWYDPATGQPVAPPAMPGYPT